MIYIDKAYVDGVSQTYGMPRQHIWTFAADRDKSTSFCPCANSGVSISPLVGRDYFVIQEKLKQTPWLLAVYCGVEEDVMEVIVVVVTTVHPGSTSSCLIPPLNLLNSECVQTRAPVMRI